MKFSKRIVFVFVIVIFAGNGLFAQKITLTGTVKGSNENLHAATVTVANQTTITDHKGQFSFSLNPGTYIITITHAGYKKIETTITIAEDKKNNVEFHMVPGRLLEEVTIMGSRTGTPRSNLNTAVPVDVISSANLTETNQPSLIQMLNYSLPSFNAERQKIYEPVTYRGMDPHHLLILLNNTRYHGTAWLNTGVPKSDLGRGSVYNDISTIPFIAVEKIEVLRDGASAQYGSDAIAAVLNVRLKESTGQTFIQANTGQFYAGDGFKSWIGIYRGYKLNNKRLPSSQQGFVSFSAEVRSQNPTTRLGEYNGLVYETYSNGMSSADSARIKAKDDSAILANGLNRGELTKYNGTPKLRSFGLLVNGRYPVNNNIKLFWTVTGNYKKHTYRANYRYPNDPARVNKFLYPNGFRPIGTSANWDATAIGGVKGITGNNWNWEFSSSFGNNINPQDVFNSNNASQQDILGVNAPTSFYLGTFTYSLFSNHINFTKDLVKKDSRLKSAKIIIGAEWRLEKYKSKSGDEAAVRDYDLTGPKQGGSQPSIGSVGAGDAVNKNRTASSLYSSLELEPDDRLLIDIASRYEYYSDFGGNLAGKFAIRYKFSPKFLLRGSVSNGYRAPSLQQRYFAGIQSFRGTSQIQRVFNNESPVTRAFHIPSLTAEKAFNVSAGFTSKLSGNISFTADAYLIQIKNRIVLSGVFRRTDPQVNAILINYPGIDLVQLFTNAINTRTWGIDAVLNGNWNIRKTNVAVTLTGNINRQTVFGGVNIPDVVTDIQTYTNTLFGIEERTTLKRDQPGEKLILSSYIKNGKWGFTLRNTFFGSTESATIVTNPVDTVYEFFSARVLTDFSINYKPKSWATFTLGANNVFNVYPVRSLRSNGSIPYGANGGYYFLNMSFNF